jgi:hypothetical protein
MPTQNAVSMAPGSVAVGRSIADFAGDRIGGIMLKAFVLCNEIADNAANSLQKDLIGAGLARIEGVGQFPAKLSFWAFIQIADQKATGTVRLAIMRADSGRRIFFRPVTLYHDDMTAPTILCVRLYECNFPDPGIYFVELWYDDDWLVDQRLDLK